MFIAGTSGKVMQRLSEQCGNQMAQLTKAKLAARTSFSL
jgi:hypothetical protein